MIKKRCFVSLTTLFLLFLLLEGSWKPAISASQPLTCPASTDSLLEVPQTLNVLTMLPFPDPDPLFNPSWNEGHKVLPALYLARDQINSRADILPCHQLELVVAGGGCDIASTTAVNLTVGLIGSKGTTRVVGMVGPGCSTSALQTAHMLNQPEIELLQIHGGGSPLLADRSEYNNSLGILGSTQSFVDLSIALMRKSGWQNIAILFESNRVYYRSTKEAFVAALNSNVSVLFNSPVYTQFYPLDGVRSSLARIVFVFTAPSHSSKIMCLAYHMGMVYPAYQWVIISRRLAEFVGENASLTDTITFRYGQQSYTCSVKQILEVALQGTFMLNYQLISPSYHDRRLANTSFDTFLGLYEERANEYNVSMTYWSYYFYDAVWAWAKVLDRVTDKNGEIFDHFDYGNKTMANLILSEFYARDFEFEGMSGVISFNSSTGFFDRPSDLYQVIDGVERYVAYNNGTDIVKLQSLDIIPDIVRTGDRTSVILIAIFVIIQLVEFVTVVVLQVLMIVYRNERSVRASSIKLIHLAYVGTYVLLFGVTLNLCIEIKIHSNEVGGIVCQAIWGWIYPIGFTLTIGTVTVRTWRLYRIFAHYLDPGRFISNTALMVMIAILLCIDLVIAVVWTAVDPFVLVVVENSVQVGPATELVLDRSCRSRYGLGGYAAWTVIIMSIRITLLVVMVVLSLLTRRIPNKTFTTSSLRVFSYTFSAAFFLGFMLFYLTLYLNLSINITYTILHVMLNTCILLYIACVFIPPLSPIIRQKVKDYRDNSVWLSATAWPDKRKASMVDVFATEPRIRKTSTDKLI